MNPLTLLEYTRSQTAVRLALPNNPTPDALKSLHRLHAEREKIETLIGQRLVILSGYRSPSLNAKVGGSPNSYHMAGCAMDFDPPPGLTHDELQQLIATEGSVDFDLILEEKAKDGAHWLHFQIAKPGAVGRRKVRDAELDKQGGAITRVSVG